MFENLEKLVEMVLKEKLLYLDFKTGINVQNTLLK